CSFPGWPVENRRVPGNGGGRVGSRATHNAGKPPVVRNSIMEHPVVPHEEWLAARKALLEKEKAFTRQGDELARLVRDLPWETVTKEYVFDGPNGRETLTDLFAGRSQLVVYHFMFHPDQDAGCPHCSLRADGFGGIG